VIAAASSRVEAKLFSVMNAFRSRKKCSTRFIQVSDAVTAPLTVHHLVGADALLPQIADVLIADTAFDADDRVIRPLAAAGKSAVIPPRRNRLTTRAFDQELYKARNLIKNFFAKLKPNFRCARRSWRDPAGASPAQVRGSARLVTSVASWKVTTTAKRTQ